MPAKLAKKQASAKTRTQIAFSAFSAHNRTIAQPFSRKRRSAPRAVRDALNGHAWHHNLLLPYGKSVRCACRREERPHPDWYGDT